MVNLDFISLQSAVQPIPHTPENLHGPAKPTSDAVLALPFQAADMSQTFASLPHLAVYAHPRECQDLQEEKNCLFDTGPPSLAR